MKTHYKPLVSILETKNSELVRAGRDDKKKKQLEEIWEGQDLEEKVVRDSEMGLESNGIFNT